MEGATPSQGNQIYKDPEVRVQYIQENTGHLSDQRGVVEGVTKLKQGSEIEFSMKDALGPKGNGTLWKEL